MIRIIYKQFLNPFVFSAVVYAGVLLGATPKVSETDVLRNIGMDQASIRTVTVISPAPFIGDTLIMVAPLLYKFHRLYPKAVVKLVSPTTGVFEETDWLKLQKMDLKDLITRELFSELLAGKGSKFLEDPLAAPAIAALYARIRGYISAELGVDSYVVVAPEGLSSYLWNESLRRPFDLDQKSDTSKFNFISPLLEHSFVDAPGVIHFFDLPDHFVRLQIPKAWPQAQRYDAIKRHRFSLKEGDRKKVYERMRIRMKWLFGENDTVVPYDILSRPMDPQKFRKSLAAEWQDVTRPYVLINTSTAGRAKSLRAAQTQYALVKEMISSILENYPEMNVLVVPMPPVASREAEIQQIIDENQILTDQYLRSVRRTGRVAVLPSFSPDVWAAAIDEARAVLSQDSGLVHIAMARKGGFESVVSFSSGSASLAWSRVGQLVLPNFYSHTTSQVNTDGLLAVLRRLFETVTDPCIGELAPNLQN